MREMNARSIAPTLSARLSPSDAPRAAASMTLTGCSSSSGSSSSAASSGVAVTRTSSAATWSMAAPVEAMAVRSRGVLAPSTMYRSYSGSAVALPAARVPSISAAAVRGTRVRRTPEGTRARLGDGKRVVSTGCLRERG